jgi:hypothetical protein
MSAERPKVQGTGIAGAPSRVRTQMRAGPLRPETTRSINRLPETSPISR